MTDENHTDWLEGEPTEEEVQEALALARALERGTGGPELTDEAFSVASMLQYAQDGGELGGAKLDSILDEVFETARVPEPVKANPWAWLKWALPSAGALMAAAVFGLFFVSQSSSPPSAETAVVGEVMGGAAALPPVTTDLLRAQAQSASGKGPEDLDDAMTDYRSQLFASLDDRYNR